MTKIPKNLQGILWSKNVSSLDLQQDKNYIIHQVLMYGSLAQIDWLKSVYPDKEITNVFINTPRKVYTPSAFNLIKNYLLKIDAPLPKEKYVKSLY